MTIYPLMNLKKIMDIDRTNVLRNRTWWWWFWLFFFEPEKGERWKQLMILWGTRNCKKLKVDDMIWENRGALKRKEGAFEVPGITAAWYFDGEKMLDPLFLESGLLTSQWSRDSASLNLKSAGSCTFSSNNGNFGINAEFKNVKLDLDISEWKPHLHKLVPTGKKFLGFLGYKMVKIRACKVDGIVETKGKVDRVKGTTYFQKVRINSPTSPWYFGVFHSARGDYLDYFMPHLGFPMFRRSPNHKSKLDFWERTLSKGVHFIDVDGNNHSIKNVKIRKIYENELPVFHLSGWDNGKKLEMEMRPYSRAYWRIEQPLLRFSSTILYYNEYPAYISEFKFEDSGRTTTLDDMGFTIGNCEHSWGMV